VHLLVAAAVSGSMVVSFGPNRQFRFFLIARLFAILFVGIIPNPFSLLLIYSSQPGKIKMKCIHKHVVLITKFKHFYTRLFCLFMVRIVTGLPIELFNMTGMQECIGYIKQFFL